jgi:hypothetical protein
VLIEEHRGRTRGTSAARATLILHMRSFSMILIVSACSAAAKPSAATPADKPIENKPVAGPAETMKPPKGFEWRDRKGDIALAAGASDEPDESGYYTCEVWNVKTRKRLARLTGQEVAAGGAEPDCIQLSPGGTLVEWGNGRRNVWKNLQDHATNCSYAVVAPDDSSCIEDDTSPFTWLDKSDAPQDLELTWSHPIAVEGKTSSTKVVAKIPGGYNRVGGDSRDRWWTVKYCSPQKAVIDIKGGTRVVVDTTNGTSTTLHVKAGEPAC